MENLDEKTRIQKELISAQIPTEALEVWEIKQFTMHERMFETEEKLREARKQFQKIASDVDDWASLEYLRAHRDSALISIEGLQHVTQSAKRTPSYAITTPCVKLPPIRTNAGRATLKEHPVFDNLNSALLNKKKGTKTFRFELCSKGKQNARHFLPEKNQQQTSYKKSAIIHGGISVYLLSNPSETNQTKQTTRVHI